MSQHISHHICRITICAAVFSAAGCGSTDKARMENYNTLFQGYIIGAPVIYAFKGTASLIHDLKVSSENRELRDNYEIWAKARRELNEKEQAAKRSQAQPAPSPQGVP